MTLVLKLTPNSSTRTTCRHFYETGRDKDREIYENVKQRERHKYEQKGRGKGKGGGSYYQTDDAHLRGIGNKRLTSENKENKIKLT